MRQKGFTLVELMIVLGILMITVMIMGAFSTASTGKGELLDATTEAKDILRRAQWQSMHGKNDDSWGVHFEIDKYTLFKGASYSALDPYNYEIELSDTIEISDISLTGGGSDVVFTDEFGNTLTDGAITLSNTVTGDDRVIDINSVGMIDAD